MAEPSGIAELDAKFREIIAAKVRDIVARNTNTVATPPQLHYLLLAWDLAKAFDLGSIPPHVAKGWVYVDDVVRYVENRVTFTVIRGEQLS